MTIVSKNITQGKKIYFISDCHLGIPDYKSSLAREKKLVALLESIEPDAQEIYLLGDIFDFWFEYRHVVPKGYVRLLGKLAQLTDKGITINFFTGNHDMWVRNYFKDELGLRLYNAAILCNYEGKTFYIAHGDGLGPGDYGYKFLKKIFSNFLCKWLFARLHPNFAYSLALFFSRRSRLARGETDSIYLGEEKERLICYAKNYLKTHDVDYFIFGHRHLPLDINIGKNSRYLNIGDWFSNFSYVVFDGQDVFLKKFE
ncbi:MAG: UDP-2,3-diacylglucosamine hydrolase [Bacteroidetes bacterium ADurb.Bin408]|nr:MAG: UDP-2,3-diacylglucosamine hydrolase [Bacteroidetes bacterium ADurb.Bin408]